LIQYKSLSNVIPKEKNKYIILNNEISDLIAKLKLIFEPRSIAFLGATDNQTKWGFRIFANIVFGGYQGRLYPINPTKEEILGKKVYKTVAELPEVPDLAVIAIPPPGVPRVLQECADKGIKAVVVITAGFAEVDRAGENMQAEIAEIARRGGIRFIGPNTDGIVNPHHKLYAEMPPIFPYAGPVSIVSQSGNIVGTMMRMAIESGFGCAKCISSGNEANLHAEDYIRYLADDPQTKVILSYVEGFKDGSRFFETAKEVTKKKPIVMLKTGETSAGAIAARSHTASLAGLDTIVDAMCQQSGIVRVRHLDELVDSGTAFLCHQLPRGRRVGIVTAGGGWGVLCADACAKNGLDVVQFPPELIEELNSFMPPWWSHGNPVDLVAGIFGEAVLKCVEIVLRSPAVDGVIFLGIMPALPAEQFRRASIEDRDRMREAILAGIIKIFETLKEMSARHDKPIVVGSEPIAFGAGLANKTIRALANRNCVCYNMPHKPAAAFASLAKYAEYLNQNGK
jgi:acyl-CoA synthetase (NDP forming)